MLAPLEQKDLEQKDLAPVAEEFFAGNRTQALAILTGVLTTFLTASPILGGAATGLVTALASLLADSAMKRAEAAGQKLQDERAFVGELQGAVSSCMKEDFGALLAAIGELQDQGQEQFLQTINFTRRNVAEPVEETRGLVRELHAALRGPRGERTNLLGTLRTHLVATHGSLSGLFAEFLGELDSVFVELDLCDERRGAPGRGHLGSLTLRELLELPTCAEGEKSAPYWVVLGDPGGGKTTLARHLVWELSTKLDGPLALYVSLPRLVSEGMHPFALAERDVCAGRGAAEGKGLAAALFELAQQPNRLWLLLDGLDEVAPKARGELQALANGLPNVAMAVLTRPVGYQPLGGPFQGLARIQRLNSGQQRDLLGRWLTPKLGEGASRTAFEGMSLGLRDACQLPLMLTLYAHLVLREPERPRPAGRRQLLERSIETLLAGTHKGEGEFGVHDPGAARVILGELCLVLQEKEAEKWPRARLEDLLRGLKREEGSRTEMVWDPDVWRGVPPFLDDVSAHSGVLAAHDGPENPWGFLHRQFREVLAAEALTERGREAVLGRAKSLAANPEAIPRWAEVIGYACERDREPLELLRVIAEADEELALRVLPEVESVDLDAALEVLLKYGRWNGDFLLGLVNRWRERPGFDLNRAVDWLWRQVQPDRSTIHLAYVHYALEGLSGAVDRERFFMACDRWSEGDPPRPELVSIQGGEFLMGSPESEPERDDDEVQHRVHLSPFLLSPTAVTNAEYERFDFSHRRETFGGSLSPEEATDHPVVTLSWWEARLYCAWAGGRLPTEAEWEYACRAGTTTPFSFGENITSEQVNYNGKFPYADGAKGVFRRRMVPAKSLPPNAWGLYEMHGNVWEWCSDWYGAYAAEEQRDPVGPALGQNRVIRGGSWNNYARACRSAMHYRYSSDERRDGLGFRLLAVQPGEPASGGAGGAEESRAAAEQTAEDRKD